MKEVVYLSDELIKNPAFWITKEESFYYSGHYYRGSAIETDNSCGNCDGANCDFCKKIVVEPHYEFCAYTDVIYADLIKQGIDEDVASDLAYNDFGCRTHILYMPSEHEIPEETRLLIETPCKEVWDWCNSHKDTFELFELRDQYRRIMQAKGISWDDGLDFYLNQIDFWIKTRSEFIESRRIYRDDLKNLCVRQQWYTKGDCKAYEKLLDMCDEDYYMDNTRLYMMAKDIIAHSNMKNEETITSVMFELARLCVVTFDERK